MAHFSIRTSDSYGIVLLKPYGSVTEALYAYSDGTGCTAYVFLSSNERLVNAFKTACRELCKEEMWEHDHPKVKVFMDLLDELNTPIGYVHDQLMKLF